MKTYKLTARQNGKRRTGAARRHWRANAPAWYRRMVNAELRAINRAAMQRLRQGVDEDAFEKWVRNVNYMYW